MNPIKGYCNYMKRVFRMNERMTRAEFWPYFIFNFLVLYALDPFMKALAVNGHDWLLNVIFFLLLFYFLGPIIQRVNDGNLRKRFLFLLIVPYAGAAIVFWMCLKKSYPGTTEFGPCRA